MKKVVTAIFLFLFCCFSYSQDKNTIGVKFGFVSSKFDKNNNKLAGALFKENRIGPGFDIFFISQPYSFCNIQFSLGYVQKGAEDVFNVTTLEQPNGTGQKYEVDYKMDYVTLGTSLFYKLALENFELGPFMGISYSFLFDHKGLPLNYIQTINLGYLFGMRVILKNSLKNPVFFDISREKDFKPFYSDSGLTLTNTLWSFKMGFFYN